MSGLSQAVWSDAMRMSRRLGIYSSGGGEFATLTVTYPAGATLTCSNGTKTLTAETTTGTYTFSIPKAGTWAVTIAVGNESNSTTVTFSQRGEAKSISISFNVVASTTAKSGVSYTSGLSGISQADLSKFARAISNNSAITNNTNDVYVDYGSIHRRLTVGNQVAISMNGTSYNFDIIGFNHDTLTTASAYGSNTATGKAGITFLLHDLTQDKYQMNSTNTNSGGWRESAMRKSTMPLMKSYMPAAWRNIIKPVNKSTSRGGGMTTIYTDSDECFLLSEIEIMGNNNNSFAGEGSQYKYYSNGSSRIKNQSGSPAIWYERSPKTGSSSDFCRIYSNGNATSSTASDSRGIAFAFCV